MLSESQSLQLLDAALAACECDQAEAILHTTNSSLTRFAESIIHQNVAEADNMINVRAILGNKIGCARGNQVALAEVQAVAQRALDLARVASPDEAFVSLPGPQSIQKVHSFAEPTAASTPEQRAEAVRAIVSVAEAHGCRASGSFSVESGEVAVANSLGVRAYAPATEASLVAVISDDESSGYAQWRGLDISQLDPVAVAESAARKCADARGADAIEPGEYTVILEPLAVGDMLFMLAYMGLGAQSLQEGRSFLAGRLGEKVIGDNITIWDDATDLRQLAFPFDWEGLPKQKTMLIEKGVARGVAYDSYTAHKEEKQSTGHAFPAPNPYGPMPTHLFLAPGEAALEDMISSTDRAILVTRFHYTNIVHPKQTIFTGMTRDGTFLIEDGKIAHPLKNLRFTQSILEALSNVQMIGRHLQLCEYTCVPALKITGFSFTS
jgi:predicted Zn-dependent protease